MLGHTEKLICNLTCSRLGIESYDLADMPRNRELYENFYSMIANFANVFVKMWVENYVFNMLIGNVFTVITYSHLQKFKTSHSDLRHLWILSL